MKQKKKIKLIATIAILVIILIMIICAYTDKIKKNKLIKNNINALNDGDITTIDITGITPSPEGQHEHIYKTHYDDTKHWEQCTICDIKRNEITHTFTTTWKLGSESCHRFNSYTKICICGYMKKGRRPCVWNGSSVASSGYFYHWKTCNSCGAIADQYYMYSYGNGKLHSVEEEKKELGLDQFGTTCIACSLSNGSRITCNNLGRCASCGTNYTVANHDVNNNKIPGKLICAVCDKEFGTYTINAVNDSNFPATCTITIKYSLKNGATWNNVGYGLYNVDADKRWSSASCEVTKINSDKTEVTVVCKGKFKNGTKEKLYTGTWHYITIAGITCRLEVSNYFSPDLIKPVISDIKVNGNGWTKSKPITITGTENWTNTVNIKIENDRGKVVYEGSSNVTNNNWSISCTPEIEAGEEARTFTVTVTDACENSTSQTFEVSKVDGRPPTVTSSDKVTDSEWAKEKTFTFIAEDLGIGNVEIGFNDIADYSPAVKNGNNYSKEYKFVGDAYSPVKASVYFKDGLGNITTQLVTLEKIDNTAPTITNASLNNNVVSITSNDRHVTLGEGSGVVKYRYITSTEKLENPEITLENSQEIGKDEILTIANINDVKYIYVVAEDLVGNQSESYEIEVPQLELTSKVNEENTITLDWTGYNITDKYFVIYSKQEGEEEWKTIVGIEQKLNNNTYTLGNDISKPNIPEITIEKDIEANQIKIKGQAQDNGTKYTYYIEAYDKNTNTLIARSNINKR